MCKTKKDVVKTGQKFKTNHFFHSTHNGINIKIQLEEYLWTHLSTYSFLNKLLIRWIVAPYILDQKCISMFFKKKIYHCEQVELHTGVEKHEYIWYWYFIIIPTFFAYTPCTVGYLWDHTHRETKTHMHAWMNAHFIFLGPKCHQKFEFSFWNLIWNDSTMITLSDAMGSFHLLL